MVTDLRLRALLREGPSICRDLQVKMACWYRSWTHPRSPGDNVNSQALTRVRQLHVYKSDSFTKIYVTLQLSICSFILTERHEDNSIHCLVRLFLNFLETAKKFGNNVSFYTFSKHFKAESDMMIYITGRQEPEPKFLRHAKVRLGTFSHNYPILHQMFLHFSHKGATTYYATKSG